MGVAETEYLHSRKGLKEDRKGFQKVQRVWLSHLRTLPPGNQLGP